MILSKIRNSSSLAAHWWMWQCCLQDTSLNDYTVYNLQSYMCIEAGMALCADVGDHVCKFFCFFFLSGSGLEFMTSDAKRHIIFCHS